MGRYVLQFDSTLLDGVLDVVIVRVDEFSSAGRCCPGGYFEGALVVGVYKGWLGWLWCRELVNEALEPECLVCCFRACDVLCCAGGCGYCFLAC